MMEIRKVAFLLLLFVCTVVSKNVSDDRQLRRIIENEANKFSSKPRHNESGVLEVRREENMHQSKWITQLFIEAEQKFDLHPNVSPQCKRDYEMYKLHLANQSVWAVRSK
ncbi:hypothetical protein V9T40_005750 [Parthenolecanium corni]|uniref:Uncharacterized protein n=1 Tax=Parthenolecanium corni TaxID=536013 RepID=A0AAN9YAS5_9HEMI